MRIHLASLSMAIGLVATASAGTAPVPPPPPNVNWPGATASAAGRPRTQGDDLVRLETDRLVRDAGVAFSGQIRTAADAQRVDLEAGGDLTLDGQTPPGRYRLTDGTTVVLSSDPGYPRTYLWIPKGPRSLYFQVECADRVGILVLRDSQRDVPVDGDLLGSYFATTRGLVGARPTDTLGQAWAAELHTDWHSRGYLPFDDNASGHVLVVWVALGSPRRPSSLAVRVERIYEHRITPPTSSAPRPDAAAPTATTESTRTPRVLRVVRVDLGTGGVWEVSR